MAVRTSKIQFTIQGFAAYAIEKLTARRGTTVADTVGYIFQRWVDDNRDYLKSFDITQEQFDIDEAKRERRVREISTATSDSSNG
jgi:hypothetical protein